MSKEQSRLVIQQGAVLPGMVRVLSVILGIVASLTIIGIPLGLLGFGLAIYMGGTEIDLGSKNVREYNGLLGARWGKWQPLAPFKAIVILRKRRVSTMYSRGQIAMDEVEMNHDVVLVDRAHRMKFVVRACDTEEEARTLAAKIAGATGYAVERYAPHRINPQRR